MLKSTKIGVVCILSHNSHIQAKFYDSIVDIIKNGKSSSLNNHTVPVYVTFSSNTLYIGSNKQNVSNFINGPSFKVLLKRPPLCPFLAMKTASFLPNDIPGKTMPIQVASVVLLESSDSMVLLTKRPTSMRTFPNVWVPPGGQVEDEESLFDAALRELKEETNLDYEGIDVGQPNLLGLWESGFPLQFTPQCPPKRHHVVSYVHFKAPFTAAQLNTKLKLQPSEVDKATWVCPCVAQKIVLTDDNLESGNCSFIEEKCFSNNCPVSLNNAKLFGAETNDNHTTCPTNNILIEPLLNRYSENDTRNERVSTGTKFALFLWLKKFDE